jgi:threonine/homoserine/homoserine lactone efflux protein
MRTYSWSLVALKIAGGLYMLWLSWKAARAALSTAAPATGQAAGVAISGAFPQDYARGLAMHLTNPKAIFVWLSIVALGLPPDAGQADAFRVVACCAGIGMLVFFGYALAFSTPLARSIYARVHRGFNAVLSVVFAAAGVRLLLSRTSA